MTGPLYPGTRGLAANGFVYLLWCKGCGFSFVYSVDISCLHALFLLPGPVHGLHVIKNALVEEIVSRDSGIFPVEASCIGNSSAEAAEKHEEHGDQEGCQSCEAGTLHLDWPKGKREDFLQQEGQSCCQGCCCQKSWQQVVFADHHAQHGSLVIMPALKNLQTVGHAEFFIVGKAGQEQHRQDEGGKGPDGCAQALQVQLGLQEVGQCDQQEAQQGKTSCAF